MPSSWTEIVSPANTIGHVDEKTKREGEKGRDGKRGLRGEEKGEVYAQRRME